MGIVARVQKFPDEARSRVGHQLNRVQYGRDPDDWKPMANVGAGVREVRVHLDGEYRVVYVAKFAEAVYVLHAFGKKTRKTSKQDLELSSARFRAVMADRRRQAL